MIKSMTKAHKYIIHIIVTGTIISIKSPSKISLPMVKPSIVEGFLEEIGLQKISGYLSVGIATAL